MEEAELKRLAVLVAREMEAHEQCCRPTEDEQKSVKELLRTKKNAVRVFFYIFGALVLYALKDLYVFVAGHLSFK